MYMCVYTYISLYIYICIEREGERDINNMNDEYC